MRIIPRWAINYGKHLPEAIFANVKYGFPAKKLRVIGVTGTDGKTTTVNMIYQVLKDAGRRVSMISTVNAVVGGDSFDTGFHVTSPDPKQIQKLLKIAQDSGEEFFVLEVTSHALSQFRVWGVGFEIGVITNITHEHLDYHKTFDRYVQAKARLIKNAAVAVLNYDDPHFSTLRSYCKRGKVVSFGISNQADLNPQKFPLKLKVPGQFNLRNGLAAAVVCQALGIDERVIREALEKFAGTPGRMEEVKNTQGIKVVVDFAHTPNALKQALKTLKTAKGKLIAVFGAAAQRDVVKRPLMGKISAELADITILTDEDPRFEDPKKIIEEIAQGAYQAGAKEGVSLFKEPNRAGAIKLALKMAKKGDTVGIFGKGHERSMNYRGQEKPWSDKTAVQQALKSLK